MRDRIVELYKIEYRAAEQDILGTDSLVGHDEAGQNLAILHSLVATCKLHDVNPYEYLVDVLIRVQTHPQARIGELLPMNWAARVIADFA